MEINSISSPFPTSNTANSIICLFLAYKQFQSSIRLKQREMRLENEEMLRVENRFDDVLLLSIYRFDSISLPPPFRLSPLLSLNLWCECIATLWNSPIDFHFLLLILVSLFPHRHDVDFYAFFDNYRNENEWLISVMFEMWVILG